MLLYYDVGLKFTILPKIKYEMQKHTEKLCGARQIVPFIHVEQSSFIQIVDMNRFFTGNPVSVRLIDYRKKS